MIELKRDDVVATLREPVMLAVSRLVKGGANDLARFGSALTELAADAALAGDQPVIDRIPSQLRALGEANRVDVAEEGVALLDGLIQGGIGVLVGLADRGLARLGGES